MPSHNSQPSKRNRKKKNSSIRTFCLCRSLLGQIRTHVREKQDLITVELDVISLRSCPAEHTFGVLIPEKSDQDGSGTLPHCGLWGECTVRSVQLWSFREGVASDNCLKKSWDKFHRRASLQPLGIGQRFSGFATCSNFRGPQFWLLAPREFSAGQLLQVARLAHHSGCLACSQWSLSWSGSTPSTQLLPMVTGHVCFVLRRRSLADVGTLGLFFISLHNSILETSRISHVWHFVGPWKWGQKYDVTKGGANTCVWSVWVSLMTSPRADSQNCVFYDSFWKVQWAGDVKVELSHYGHIQFFKLIIINIVRDGNCFQIG